jgi:hypothetical protein
MRVLTPSSRTRALTDRALVRCPPVLLDELFVMCRACRSSDVRHSDRRVAQAPSPFLTTQLEGDTENHNGKGRARAPSLVVAPAQRQSMEHGACSMRDAKKTGCDNCHSLIGASRKSLCREHVTDRKYGAVSATDYVVGDSSTEMGAEDLVLG